MRGGVDSKNRLEVGGGISRRLTVNNCGVGDCPHKLVGDGRLVDQNFSFLPPSIGRSEGGGER